MRKTSLALAVAASTLGLSQVAFADFIGDSKSWSAPELVDR